MPSTPLSFFTQALEAEEEILRQLRAANQRGERAYYPYGPDDIIVFPSWIDIQHNLVAALRRAVREWTPDGGLIISNGLQEELSEATPVGRKINVDEE